MADRDVVFRRINGHIVPISRRKLEGAGIVAGGLAVAAASGKAAAHMVRNAAYAENEARAGVKVVRTAKSAAEKLGPLFAIKANQQYIKAGEAALKTMAQSRKLFNTSLGIRNAGYTAGAALIAGGVHHALSKDNKQGVLSKSNAAVAAGAGIAAHFAIRSAFLKSMNRRGMKVSRALTEAAKAILVNRFGK